MAIVGRAKYTRARAKFRGDATRRERRKLDGAPFASRLLELSRARVCILPAPQSQSPKLETTRSLNYVLTTTPLCPLGEVKLYIHGYREKP